eukprot:5891617-Alexandrium_andersonii.AAC.1
MLAERGFAANCLKRPRDRAGRPAAGTRRSEARRTRFEAILRVSSDPGVVRAGRCVNEYLAYQVRVNVESAPTLATSSSSSGAQ